MRVLTNYLLILIYGLVHSCSGLFFFFLYYSLRDYVKYHSFLYVFAFVVPVGG